MGKHDLKAQKIQVEFINNKMDDHVGVMLPMRYTSAFPLAHPLDLITNQMLTDAVGGLPEEIPFSGASGTLAIDFTINNRQVLYQYPSVQIWIVDGDTENMVNGVGFTKNKVSGLIDNILLDGVFGSGYALLYNI